MRKTILLLSLLPGMCPTAEASILVALCGPGSPGCGSVTGVVVEAGDFRWTYQVDLSTDQRLDNATGNIHLFVIGDFDGFVTGSNTQPAGWTFSTAALGPAPFPLPLTANDEAGRMNLVWTYTGNGVVNGPVDLGLFSVLSEFDGSTLDFYGALATRHAPGVLSDGTVTLNGGQVVVAADNVRAQMVPEPEVLPLIGTGLLLIGLRYRGKR